MENKRVVITGIGPLTSAGIGKADLWKNLVEGRTNVKLEECFIDGESWDKFYLHRIDSFDIKNFGIDPHILKEIKEWKEGEEITDLYYLIAAVKLALDDSRLEYDVEDNNIGCVVAHENPGLEQYISKYTTHAFETLKNKKITKKLFAEKSYSVLMKSSYDLQAFMVLFHVLRTFGVHGYSSFINSACSSGLYAIETASQIIKTGRCSVVIVVAADYPRIYKYLWFKQLNMYAQDGKIKPFAKEPNGFVFGDGGAGLVLEDLEYAIKRKARIYAEYLGGGFSQEGWKVTVPAIGKDFYQKTIKEALRFSKIEKENIDLLCTHGAGNSIIDRYEAKAVTDIFGIRPKRPLITAFKPYIGNTLGAGALLETAILLLCLDNNVVLPVLNTQEVDPRMKMDIVKNKIKIELKTVLKICCAFAGYDAAAVFRKINL